MAKTLKQFLEGYLKVKSADEQKFIDKHVTVKNPDRNGNGDDVFKGKTKPVNRRKERHGYEVGEDEKVYEELKGNQHKIDANKNGKVDAHDFKLLRKKKMKEEAVQIDELRLHFNADDANNNANAKKMVAHLKKRGIDAEHEGGSMHRATVKINSKDPAHHTYVKNKVKDRYDVHINEEAEQIDELSTDTLRKYREKARDDAFDAHDVDDDRRLRKRSFGANQAGKKILKRGESLRKEEAEQIDELSKGTMANYAGRAMNDVRNSNQAKIRWQMSKQSSNTSKEMEAEHDRVAKNREKGVRTAIKKLAKEESEQIDELSKATLGSYAQKSKDDLSRSEYLAGKKMGERMHGAKPDNAERKLNAKTSKRYKGLGMAINKLAKEEAEQIDEISKGTAMKALQYAASDTEDHRGYTLQKKIDKKWPEMKNHTGRAAYTAAYGRPEKVHGQERDKLADRAKTSYRMTKAGKANKQDLKARFRKEEVEHIDEAGYSAKVARAGKDLGKPGKNFSKIANKAAAKYGSKASGERVAGAVLAKLRKEEKLAEMISDLSESHQRTMMNVFEKLNEDNKSKFLQACDTPEGVEQMLDFAINNRGE